MGVCLLLDGVGADLLNVWITLELLGWQHEERQVLILDAHRIGPLDVLWPVAAAGGGPAVLPAAREAVRQGGTPWDVRLPQRQQQQQQQQAPPQSEGGGASEEGGGGSSGSGRLLVRRVADLPGPTLFHR